MLSAGALAVLDITSVSKPFISWVGGRIWHTLRIQEQRPISTKVPDLQESEQRDNTISWAFQFFFCLSLSLR